MRDSTPLSAANQCLNWSGPEEVSLLGMTTSEWTTFFHQKLHSSSEISIGHPICSFRRETAYNALTGETYLLIRSITSDDDGEYTCTAVNAAGEAVLVVAVVREITGRKLSNRCLKFLNCILYCMSHSTHFELALPRQPVSK